MSSRLSLLASQVTAGASVASTNIESDALIALESAAVVSADFGSTIDLAADIEADAIAVESYADMAEGFQGGLNAQAAQVMALSVDHFASRWGLKQDQIAVESFEDNPSMATQIACESVKDMASSMWQAFLDLLKSIRAKFKDLMAKYNNAGKKLVAAFEKLEEKTGDLGDIKDGKDKVKGDFLKSFVWMGKPNAGQVRTFCDSAEAVSKSIASSVESIGKDVDAALSQGSAAAAEGKAKALVDAPDLKTGYEESSLKSKFSKLFEDADTKISSVTALPRDSYIVLASSEKKGSTQSHYVTGVDLSGADSDIETLSVKDINAWIGSGIKAAKAMEQMQKDWSKTEAAQDKVVKSLEKLAKKAKDAKDEERTQWRAVNTACKGSAKAAQHLERGNSEGIANAARAAYGYCAASVAAYDKA